MINDWCDVETELFQCIPRNHIRITRPLHCHGVWLREGIRGLVLINPGRSLDMLC